MGIKKVSSIFLEALPHFGYTLTKQFKTQYFQQLCSIALYHHQTGGAKECYSGSIVLIVILLSVF